MGVTRGNRAHRNNPSTAWVSWGGRLSWMQSWCTATREKEEEVWSRPRQQHRQRKEGLGSGSKTGASKGDWGRARPEEVMGKDQAAQASMLSTLGALI